MMVKQKVKSKYYIINKRLLASTIDMLIYLYLIRYIMYVIRFNAFDYPVYNSKIETIILCLYFQLKDFIFKNASIGKKILGLKVIMKDGTPVKWYILILRNTFYYPVLMFLDFPLVCLLNTRFCDLILKTTVVEKSHTT